MVTGAGGGLGRDIALGLAVPRTFASDYVSSMGMPPHPGAAWCDPEIQQRQRAEMGNSATAQRGLRRQSGKGCGSRGAIANCANCSSVATPWLSMLDDRVIKHGQVERGWLTMSRREPKSRPTSGASCESTNAILPSPLASSNASSRTRT